QVFAKLIGVIGSYKEREVPLFAWILRVARNAAIDHIRKRRLVPVEEVRAAQEHMSDVRGATRASDLKEALATLPHAQREVLVLRQFAGLSPSEIATRTGRTEGSIHGLHHRGRRALSAELISRVAALDQQVAREQAARSGPWINTNSYAVPIATVGADQPNVAVALDHAPDAALSEAWSAVPLPASAQASSGSDGYMVVWQPSSGR